MSLTSHSLQTLQISAENAKLWMDSFGAGNFATYVSTPRVFRVPNHLIMTNSSLSPLRVADLPNSPYASTVPLRTASTSALKPKEVAPPECESNTQYAWNAVEMPRTEMLEEIERHASSVEKVEVAKSYEDLFQIFKQQQNEIDAPEPPMTCRVWGIDYHAVTMDQTLDYLEKLILARQPAYAVTANLNYAMLCQNFPRLDAFTRKAALVLCDGMPAVWRSKLDAVKLPERVAGADLIYRLSERCAQRKFRVYLYGAAEGVAERAASKLKELYPGLIIAGVQCPPFHNTSSEQIQNQIAKIRHAKPDVLFVALGQPKGEYWIEDHLKELHVPLCIQLGASFDFVAGNCVRAPRFIQAMGLEWLYRTIRDPKRLGPRYFQNLLFLLKALRRELLDQLS